MHLATQIHSVFDRNVQHSRFVAGLQRSLTALGQLFSETIKRLMKTCSLIVVVAIFMVFTHVAGANQADDTTITITGHTAGATPFISKLTLEVSNTAVLKSIQFAIDPKPGSVTRPLSGTYSNDYLVSRGFEHPPEIILPVYGLYAGYANIVRLTYRFLDGSSKQAVTSITTATFNDPCGYKNPTILQRTYK